MGLQSVEACRTAERALWEHYGAEPTERFLDLAKPKARTRVLIVGDGPPVLFVHGSPNAGSTRAPLAERLQDFRCIILDRPGCGFLSQ
jgi:pimeloyl-ACP methyl ester carboxylesterase